MDVRRSTQELVAVNRKDAKSWRVLVVDDEKDNLRVISKLLVFLGAEVHTARSGLEGLDMLKKIKPTFILSDLSMPMMNGWRMFKEVRNDPETQQIPIIAITAHAKWGTKESLLAEGFDGYIAKPFGISTFLTEIQRCLACTGVGV
jgi:CheY-like chemotaxis protein